MMSVHKPVVFIINSLEGGGAERVMCKLLSAMESYFKERNTPVYLLLLDDVPQAHECPAYVNKIVLNTKGTLFGGYLALRKLLKKLQPAIALSFLTRSNLLNIVLGKQLGYRAIISERVNTSSHFPGGVKDEISKAMVRFVYPRADTIIAVSEGVKADLVQNYGVPSSIVETVYNPYDIEHVVALSQEPVSDCPSGSYIIGTGRLVKNKNFALMIKAFAASSLEDDLVILGQGEEQSSLEALAASLGVEQRVHFMGFKANPYPYIRQARFFVSTSNAEGFPNAIVEAMCLSKAVVATNCESGPAEILSEKYPLEVSGSQAHKHGCLCEVNNVDGVAAAMDFLNDDIRCEQYAYKSSARARDFSTAIFRQKIIGVLEKDSHSEGMAYVRAG